jgi:hypothetical protein
MPRCKDRDLFLGHAVTQPTAGGETLNSSVRGNRVEPVLGLAMCHDNVLTMRALVSYRFDQRGELWEPVPFGLKN